MDTGRMAPIDGHHIGFPTALELGSGDAIPDRPKGGQKTPKPCTPRTHKVLEVYRFTPTSVPLPAPGTKFRIGYGHLCIKPTCPQVPYPIPLTEASATSLLQSDAQLAGQRLVEALNPSVKLNNNQYSALVFWALNRDCGVVKGSLLVSKLRNGVTPNTAATEELPKWNTGVDGKLSMDLDRHRMPELNLFKTASSIIVLPC
ncbi:hypothetical protein BGX33_009325 [Mortierella sp. NVP41]|nr:hypothetical protein BGX33_009325 [Mortierella sp. NVP41]